MQLYGCNISSLYGVNEEFDIFLIGLPGVPRKEVTIYVRGNDIEADIPEANQSDIKLLIYNQKAGTCNILDIERQENVLLIEQLLKEYDIGFFEHIDTQLLYLADKEVMTIGKFGFCAVSMKTKRKDYQKVYLRSSCFDVLGKRIDNVKYTSMIVPEEKNRVFFTSLRKIANGSRVEVKDMIALFTNSEEIFAPFHIDLFKDFELHTMDFSFRYNQIDATIEATVQGEEYVIKEDSIIEFPDMFVGKICFSIRGNTLKEDISTYFV